VRMEIRRAWTNWSALAAQHAATRGVRTHADEVVALVDVMERSGEIARTQGRLFRIEQATKAADLATLESRVEESELRLKRLMGLSPDAPVAFQASGIGPAPMNGAEHASDAWEPAEPGGHAAAIERSNPALRVARAEYAAAEKALELAIRAQYPDLVIGPGFGREDGMDQVLLGLSVPLPILNANRGAIAEARAQRDVAYASAQAALEGALADVHAAMVRRVAATARREALESTIIPLVEAQYADARELARLGEVNTLVLLESITRQHAAHLALIDARREEALAQIDLAEVLGDPDEVDATVTTSETLSNASAATTNNDHAAARVTAEEPR
jgi:outer membrane protein TolC